MTESDPVDAVFTWVDDSFPGYLELRDRWAGTPHDRNPNRTRDNLELLKYALRSLVRHAPWVRSVHLVTCRPQVPHWLAADHPGLVVHHHDEFMDPAVLPTFNSFAIMSFLGRIPGVSRRFLRFDDDMLVMRPVGLDDFVAPDGRIVVHTGLGATADPSVAGSDRLSPWNTGLAHTNGLLNRAFGVKRRGYAHAPQFVDADIWNEMLARWPEDVARTRADRFRAKYDVVPEHLYSHYLLETGRGVSSVWRTWRDTGYHGIENFLPWAKFGFALAEWRRPKTLTLNDNFGDRPNPAVVRMVRATLERWFPAPSPFERRP